MIIIKIENYRNGIKLFVKEGVGRVRGGCVEVSSASE
jgi:hypothetical protein